MSSPNQIQNISNPAPIGAELTTQSRQQPSTQRYAPFPSSRHAINRGRYITSNDPRGYLPVFEYSLGDQMIMMDCDDGYVLWTSICKALHKTKADITKMVESDPELPARIRRIKGGYLKVQGTWIPHESARALAQRIAWPIRDDLVPLFGPDFPATCIPPSDPAYGDILNPRGRVRRNTQPAPVGASPTGPSSASPLQVAGQTWMGSNPIPLNRRDTTLSEPGNTRYGSLSSSPRAVRSNTMGQSPSTHVPYGLSMPSYGQVGQSRYVPSQGSSPSHTMPDDGTDSPVYGTPSYPQPSQSYPGYYLGSSPPTLAHVSSPTYSSQPSQPTGYSMHPVQTSPPQQYLSQPATPTHTMSQAGYGSTGEYDTSPYGSHGVSGAPRQPCDTYPQDQAYSGGYGSQYQAQADAYSPYQAAPQTGYGAFTGDSGVRYSGDVPGYGMMTSSTSRVGMQQPPYGYQTSPMGSGGASPQRSYASGPAPYDEEPEYQSPPLSHVHASHEQQFDPQSGYPQGYAYMGQQYQNQQQQYGS